MVSKAEKTSSAVLLKILVLVLIYVLGECSNRAAAAVRSPQNVTKNVAKKNNFFSC